MEEKLDAVDESKKDAKAKKENIVRDHLGIARRYRSPGGNISRRK